MLQHEAHRIPVTALAFSEHYLFAGQGPSLKVHRKDNAHLVESHKVFDSQAVHGIAISGTAIVVWGGHQIVLFHLLPSGSSTILEPSSIPLLRLQDWILDVSISPYCRPDSGLGHTAAVLTAHNALILLHLDPYIENSQRLIDLTSTSRCILYSANLYWVDPEHILVASGTVFGEIILWSCNIGDTSSPKSVLHQLLTGHDGSIFGVRILESSPTGTVKRHPQLLASCSDDRTVRIWDITNLPETPLNPQTAADLSSARETGFGSNIADMLPDQATAGHCVAQAWGHASRIWDVRFLPFNQADDLTYFMSFGEDATNQLWALEPSSVASDTPNKSQRKAVNLDRTHVHSGKNIWSSAIEEASDNTVTVATGGADGSIVLSNYDRPFTPVSDFIKSWSVDTILSNAPIKPIGKSDKLRGYAFVTEQSLIISTDSGNVFLLETAPANGMSGDRTTACTWISQEPKLRGYSVVASLSALGIAFLAGIDGTVLMYQAADPFTIRELTKCSVKTAALLARPLIQSGADGLHASVLVTNVESKVATLLNLSNATRSSTVHDFEVSSEWTVELPPGFIVTSFLLIPTDCAQPSSPSLVLGSRNGSVALYSLNADGLQEQQPRLLNHTVLHGIHGKDAITDLSFVAAQPSSTSDNHVVSVGRDGSFVILRIVNSAKTTSLHLVNRTSLPLGTLMEGVRLQEDNDTLTCWGFYSKKFLVWDMTSEREIMSVDCGGANRTWKFEPSSNSNGGVFAWTKASQLCLSAQAQYPPQIHDGGGHGREIKSIAVRPAVTAGCLPGAQVFATGSEDTNIKLFVYEENTTTTRHFRCLRTLRKHNTGIQNLQWSSDGQYLFSSGGFEEFFVWRIQPAPFTGIGVVCESFCPTESELPDLRIMNFSARPVASIEDGPDGPDGAKFIVSMVRSDSTLRVYSYTSSIQGAKWGLLFVGNYLTSCLTQCLDIDYSHGRMILTTGTDGHVAMWPVIHTASGPADVGADVDPATLHWTSRHKVHQNTIHCLLLHWIEKSKDCVLITGSDDNSFAVTRYTWDGASEKPPKVATIVVPRAHAAAVTGLEILETAHPRLLSIATTGLDQKIKVWRISIDPTHPGIQGVSIKRVQTVFTPVADVSDMAAITGRSGVPAVIICGVGLDVWHTKPARAE